MNISPFHMAAIAVVAIDGLRVAGTNPPFITTDDYILSGVVDTQGQHWIVKYPRTDHAGTLLEAEGAAASALLEELRRGNLSFDVLHPEGWAAYEGRRAMVCPAPLGKTIDWSEFTSVHARELGRSLARLHSLDPAIFTSAGLPSYDAHAVHERLFTELDDASDAASIPAVLRRRWLNMLDDAALWNFSEVPLHGDLADENLLWSEGSLRTVIGFGEAYVGDPAVDIAPIMASLDASLFSEFFDSYQHSTSAKPDEHLLERATFMSEFALVQWLMHGILTHDDDICEEADAMLSELAADIEADPETAPSPAWHIESPALSGYSPTDAAYGDASAEEYPYAAGSADSDYAGDDYADSDCTDNDYVDDDYAGDDYALSPGVSSQTEPLSSQTERLSPLSAYRTTPATALTADLALTADAALTGDAAWSADEA